MKERKEGMREWRGTDRGRKERRKRGRKDGSEV